MSKVTVADLELAATWLESYEADDHDFREDGSCRQHGGFCDPDSGSDEAAATMFKVAGWLRGEAQRRTDEKLARYLVSRTGTSMKRARQQVRALREDER